MFTNSSSESEVEWHRAFDNKDLDSVVRLTEQDGMIKSILGFDVIIPLVQAATKSLPITKFIYEAGAQVNDPTMSSATPLTAAISCGKNEIAKFLIQKGANPNLQPAAASTPLTTAARATNKEMMVYLLQHSANIQQIDCRDKSTALITATKYAEPDTVKVLLSHGADPNMRDTSGCSALDYAVKIKDEAKTRLLLEHGADPYASRDKSILKFLSLRIWPKFSRIWNYQNPQELIQRISNANLDNSFKIITWEWEVPALLELNASAGGSNFHSFSLHNHVVLLKNRSIHNTPSKSSEYILATTFGDFLERGLVKKWSKFVINLVELVELARLESENAGMYLIYH